jgi:fucose permease
MTGTLVPAPPAAPLRSAITATYVVFAGSGFALATWASRIPQVKAHLHLDPSHLGLLLLCLAIGGVISLPPAGPLVGRIGARRAVAVMSGLMAVAFALIAAGYLVGIPVLAVGLFLAGFATGCWDVAMNVHAAAAERLLGRSIMSRFHAGFSLGTVAGAVVGSIMVAAGVPVPVHVAAVAVIVAVVVPATTRRFLPEAAAAAAGRPLAADGAAGERAAEARSADAETASPALPPAPAPGPARRRAGLRPWLERRTLLVGVVALAFAFTEGAGNDWISVSVIGHRHAVPAVGTLTFAVFLAAMTAGRWSGPGLLDRFGRVAMLRATAVLAVAGLVLFVFGPGLLAALAGALLWGAGASLGFPVAMSAGADDPGLAAARVSVIATIGYCAFLIGPPLIGFLGNHITVTRALLVVGAGLAVAGLLAGSTRRPAPRLTRRRTAGGHHQPTATTMY